MLNDDKINMKYLPQYGITEEILKDMIKFDIMFPVEIRGKKNKDLYVKKSDIVMFLNQMLTNQMKVYGLVEDVETKAKEVTETIDKAETL